MSGLEISGVSRKISGKTILDDINLIVPSGQTCVLLGPSGSGKSTLLRCINHLDRIDSGIIRLNGEIIGYRQTGDKLYELSGREIARQRTQIGMVFQQYNLFPHLSVLENIVIAPIKILKKKRGDVIDQALALLKTVGLESHANALPPSLSGGQQQRVAIVRALIMQPEVMLFDEPTAALDPELVQSMARLLKQLSEQAMTMVIVTHELSFARALQGNVAFMENGRIIEHGPSHDLFTHPQHVRTADFLRQS
ncbi:arginine ABC transporter ATP-binding protein [Acetobacter senegalensis]|uniref:Arginine ABC transporter ATP-binding protein n=1 Tax=Acetobacter senegalensis TaxID=446692 RepID=A0A149U024_9PROT|nr:amino acid ABC transporter ATP-binding protein [Acetobacter senegalensis]KXV58783.1 arginine ABC transporter ATP-binding protein [Acetobacter senegalensis]MCG4256729.1 amino acid ABC transporter ATP-binding protein [Acetobacter senegalensis]MCG4266710.1 amino acid ABC transporter ATP-binding protein [Acetobacter senegalensis]